jgi:hypothetical protein
VKPLKFYRQIAFKGTITSSAVCHDSKFKQQNRLDKVSESVGELANLATKIITVLECFIFVNEVSRLLLTVDAF